MSPSKENYLKFIFELGGVNDRISNKMLSETLEIAPPSVTEMLRRLDDEGLVDYIPYKGVKLKEAGIEIAKELIRRHRIWEIFLQDNLHFTRDQIHLYAEDLEHATNQELADRLWEYLEYPEQSPDGGKISQPGQELVEDSYKTLAEAYTDQELSISRYLHDSNLYNYIETNALEIGKTFKVLKNDQGNVTISLEDSPNPVAVPKRYALKIFIN